MESLKILLSDLVRVHPGRPAALPAATGWDEELRARTAGVRLPRPGRSGSSLSRTDSSICPVMLRQPVPIGNGAAGGPESVRDGWEAEN